MIDIIIGNLCMETTILLMCQAVLSEKFMANCYVNGVCIFVLLCVNSSWDLEDFCLTRVYVCRILSLLQEQENTGRG